MELPGETSSARVTVARAGRTSRRERSRRLLLSVLTMAVFWHPKSNIVWSFRTISSSLFQKRYRVAPVWKPHSSSLLLSSPSSSSSSSSNSTSSLPTTTITTTTTTTRRGSNEESWDRMFRRLIAYHKREGHVRVPLGHKEEGMLLGAWLSRQRTAHRAGKLSARRNEKLEGLGVVYDLSEAKWESMVGHLRDYKKREGHCNVPSNYTVAATTTTNQTTTNSHGKTIVVKLGSWLIKQRQSQKKGELHPSRKKQLKSLGVVWKKTKSQRWEDLYDLLVEYKEREGHPNVPFPERAGRGPHLGFWLSTQRKLQREGGLDPRREERLEALGVNWEMPLRPGGPNETHLAKWEENFSLLEKHKQATGDCNIDRHFEVLVERDDDTERKGEEQQKQKQQKQQKQKQQKQEQRTVKLGLWLSRQRTSYKEGRLDSYRKAKLENLGVILNPTAHNFETMCSHLLDYKKREGHCNVPSGYRTPRGDQPLGAWLGNLKQAQRRGTLDRARKDRLETIGVSWYLPRCREGVWREMYGLLVRYQQREGHCKVRFAHREKKMPLGHWVSQQRVLQKKGKLAIDRFEALEKIGFAWENDGKDWVALLLKYKEREGDCLVPQKHEEDGEKLGVWVSNMRLKRRTGKLNPSVEKQLDELGMVWFVDRTAAKWEKMFALLVRYQEREGDCLVPEGYPDEGECLGRWVTRQRMAYKKGLLAPDRAAQLDDAGMVWDLQAHENELMFRCLSRYKEREGDLDVPIAHIEDGLALGEWLLRQRLRKSKGNLDPELSDRLEEAGVHLGNKVEQRWEKMFDLLVDFQNREGHCRVPQNHREGADAEKLGKWLDHQRYRQKKGLLNPVYQERLEEIGVKWSIYAKYEKGEGDDDDIDWGFEGMDHLFDDEGMYG